MRLGGLGTVRAFLGPALAVRVSTGGTEMFSEAGNKVGSLPASISASRAIVPLLLAGAAAFGLAAASGKIPVFLFTAVRALLTF